MKLLVILGLAALAAANPSNDYSKYDDFNVKEMTDNERLLSSYVHCFLGTGKCTPEGNDFKKWIPGAVQNGCSDCTDKQKSLIAQVIKAIIEKLPAEWAKLKKIHDPDNKFDAELQEFLEKYGK